MKVILDRAVDGKAVRKYTGGRDKTKATVTLVIVRKKYAKDSEPPKDKYLTFVTSFQRFFGVSFTGSFSN